MPVVFINNVATVTAAMEAAVGQVIRDTAHELVQQIQAGAPVDTGALLESIHAVTDQGSDYATAAATALALRHNGNRPGTAAQVFPEVKPSQPLEATVSAAVTHGAYNEYGTTRMAARPFFGPPWIQLAAQYQRDLEKALSP